MTLGSTQPLTEMGGKVRLVHKTDNLTAICELIVWKMCQSRRLTNLLASTACYRVTFIFLYLYE
jgi:hypothetical protein